jgi:hypothetical protein
LRGHLLAQQRREARGICCALLLDECSHGCRQLLCLFQLAELSELRHHLRIVDRIQRVLILELRDQQVEKLILPQGLVRSFDYCRCS